MFGKKTEVEALKTEIEALKAQAARVGCVARELVGAYGWDEFQIADVRERFYRVGDTGLSRETMRGLWRHDPGRYHAPVVALLILGELDQVGDGYRLSAHGRATHERIATEKAAALRHDQVAHQQRRLESAKQRASDDARRLGIRYGSEKCAAAKVLDLSPEEFERAGLFINVWAQGPNGTLSVRCLICGAEVPQMSGAWPAKIPHEADCWSSTAVAARQLAV